MLEFVDIIKKVSDGKRINRDWEDHEGVTVHRVGYDHETKIFLGDTAEEICAHFSGRDPQYPEVARATGTHLPYSIIIGRCGTPWQCLPLGDVGHHARVWSSKTIGVAVVGDPRHIELPPTQYWTLVEVCSLLSRVLGTSSNQIRGHDERPRGRGNKSKACPGKLLSMDALRFDVLGAMRAGSEQEAVRLGLVP